MVWGPACFSTRDRRALVLDSNWLEKGGSPISTLLKQSLADGRRCSIVFLMSLTEGVEECKLESRDEGRRFGKSLRAARGRAKYGVVSGEKNHHSPATQRASQPPIVTILISDFTASKTLLSRKQRICLSRFKKKTVPPCSRDGLVPCKLSFGWRILSSNPPGGQPPPQLF